MTGTDDAILRLDKVSKVFAGTPPVYAARSVSFALRAGRTLAMVGESGSGKTTCARLLMREYSADSGTISFRGAPLSEQRMGDYRRSVQMVFQDPFAALNPAHSIAYHLERPLKLHRRDLDRRARLAEMRRLLAEVRLDPEQMLAKFPHELSGGQRQRIAIARALAVRPEVIVADEPTSMLDVSVRLGILNLLNRMKREHRLALFYITHDIATARYVADDIMVMLSGQVVEWGPVDAVLTNPAHAYTRLLLSAVPDPDVRLADGRAFAAAEVAEIRAAAGDHARTITVGAGHFICS
ncbi:ATP-binding cassette domain-containing protein [Martelella sp. HB161492]|uniref:ABC transporter ATP-binding protein n=1 Tax=Martelella sp. HB161492 TaxID=2720726 RepID=UPI001FEEDA5B|nr:ATP-binding cassette domain-containing protein [Martelella sp. HB161492]